jgi:hypothetical protein
MGLLGYVATRLRGWESPRAATPPVTPISGTPRTGRTTPSVGITGDGHAPPPARLAMVRNRAAGPLLTSAVVVALALLPVFWDPWFYYTDDAATQILPMWYSLGERVLDGVWPPTLDVHSWMGGNLAIEALFGVWNPVNAVLWVLVSLMPSLAVAAVAVRILAFVALALGGYGLCREYGAARWASSAVAVTLPFCGSLFYFDAAKWPAALVAFVWVPYLWLAARRMVRGVTNAFWVFVIGALAVTAGNPYTLLAVCVVLLGLLVETALSRRWTSLLRLTLVGTAIGCVVPLVYLPLLLSGDVTWRIPQTIGYSGILTPHARDLVNLSMPGYVPGIPRVGDAAVYFCWFAAPLAMWLDWGVLRRRWRELTGGVVVAGVFLLMARGPSELWMFRWPLRVVHYGYLGVGVVLAVLLSAGLRANRVRLRAAGTAALAVLSSGLMLALAHDPLTVRRDVVSLAVVAALAVVAFWAYRLRGPRWLGAVLQVGTVVTFVLQVFWFLGYHGASPYYFPTSVADVRANYENRYHGETIQIANTTIIGPPDQPREAWRDLLPGYLYRPAGIDTLGSYTGMGYHDFSRTLCMNYVSATCPAAYPTLWRPAPGTTVPLADLLRLDTVVVQRKLINDPPVPPGWGVTDRNDRVTILQRLPPVARPAGRLSWASPDLRITANATPDDRHEMVEFDRQPQPGPARLIFARLAWPGYHAKIGDVDVPVHAGPSGLLEVDLPPNVRSGQLRISWQAPGLPIGLALSAVGFLAAIALGVQQARRGGTRPRRGSEPAEPAVEPAAQPLPQVSTVATAHPAPVARTEPGAAG